MRLLALSLLMAAALLQGPAIHAGNNKCKMEQGAPCKMDTCDHMAKKMQWCSPKCHKDCCFCAKSCNGHNPERQQNPDEEQ